MIGLAGRLRCLPQGPKVRSENPDDKNTKAIVWALCSTAHTSSDRGWEPRTKARGSETRHTFRAMASFTTTWRHRALDLSSLQPSLEELPSEGTQPHLEGRAASEVNRVEPWGESKA